MNEIMTARPEPKRKPRYCKHCGDLFSPKHAMQEYCTKRACRKVYYRRQKQIPKRPRPGKTKRLCLGKCNRYFEADDDDPRRICPKCTQLNQGIYEGVW